MIEPTTLRALLQRDGCLTIPGVYDGISARVAASVGFDALYMTGYGVVASALGVWAMMILTLTILSANSLLGRRMGTIFRV